MEITALLTEDRAASTVIGVVLMVSITVILAAVVGSMVLGIGSSARFNDHPQADFRWTTTNVSDGTGANDELTITHQTGETVRTERLSVIVGGETIYEDGSPTAPSGTSVDPWSGSSVSAGSQLTYTEDSADQFQRGDDATIVWLGPDAERSATISRYTVSEEPG